MRARIYVPAKNAMQSGRARTRQWVLEYEPERPREIEPLMGWTASADMRQQLSLDFDTAIAGNGNPLTKADVQAYKTKIDTFVGRAKEAIRQGVPKDQLMTQVKTDDFGWMPRVPAVDPFYDELSKAK